MPQPDFSILRDADGQHPRLTPMQDQYSEVVQRALLERTTVHDYSREPVARELVLASIEAAIAAPNHRMTEPWRFVLVGRPSRERLVDIATELKSVVGADPDILRAKLSTKMLNPAHLIVVSQQLAATEELRTEDYAAVACSVQNLMTSLWACGVGSKWGTGAVTRHPKTYQHLGIDPGVELIVGFLWAGIAARPPSKARRRLDLTDVLRELP